MGSDTVCRGYLSDQKCNTAEFSGHRPHCSHPYTTVSIFNISGTSHGAISKPAVLALSHVARMAGVRTNTEEGAISLGESLPLAADKLDKHGLRKRVRVVARGKLAPPAEVAWALCAGANFAVSTRGYMFTLDCIQAPQCNRNTCPTGITTHNKRLQRGLNPVDKAERVRHYAKSMHHQLGVIEHSSGVPEPRRLRPLHCRIVSGKWRSISFNELYTERKAT
jgi:glutamate synthase domain-containing protein 2